MVWLSYIGPGIGGYDSSVSKTAIVLVTTLIALAFVVYIPGDRRPAAQVSARERAHASPD